LQYIDTLTISKRDFYAKTGISRGTLESRTGITEETVAKFIVFYPEINPTWLLTGKGSQFIAYDQASPSARAVEETNQGCTAPPGCEMCKMKDVLISSLQQQIVTQSKLISRMEYAEEDKSPVEKEGQKRKVC